jgi:hypothetical protein
MAKAKAKRKSHFIQPPLMVLSLLRPKPLNPEIPEAPIIPESETMKP